MTVGNSFPGPTGVTDTTEARKAFAGLVETDASGNVRTGLFPSNTAAVVTARADMNLDVAAFTAVASQFPAGASAIFFANDGTAQLGAALVSPGAGTTNYYVVYAKQNESASPGTDANTNTVLSATLSTTSLAAARAALPQGAVELAEVTMPTGKTATNNAGVVITQTFKYTAAEGGVVWVRNSTELAAWTPADGAQAWQMDTSELLVRSGGVWAGVGPRAGRFTAPNYIIADGVQTSVGTISTDATRSSTGIPAYLAPSSGGAVQILKTGVYAFSMAFHLESAANGRTFGDINIPSVITARANVVTGESDTSVTVAPTLIQAGTTVFFTVYLAGGTRQIQNVTIVGSYLGRG